MTLGNACVRAAVILRPIRRVGLTDEEYASEAEARRDGAEGAHVQRHATHKDGGQTGQKRAQPEHHLAQVVRVAAAAK